MKVFKIASLVPLVVGNKRLWDGEVLYSQINGTQIPPVIKTVANLNGLVQ